MKYSESLRRYILRTIAIKKEAILLPIDMILAVIFPILVIK